MSTDALQQEAEEKEIVLEEEVEEQEQPQAVEEQPEEQPEEQEQPQAANEDELQEYSKNVQQRISKLTKKYRDEEAQRVAAVEFAEAVKKQNEELKQRLDALDQSYTSEFGTRVDSQIESAKQAYQKAYDDGDAEAMFEAQKNLSRLALDQAQLEQAKQRQERKAEEPAQQPQQPAAPPPQPQQPDPKAEAWAEKNEWFGSDQTMTYAAFGLHRQLIEDEGFDPQSDEYYNELDNRIKKEFPHKFAAPTKSDTGPRVASAESTASRSKSTKGRRTVKLTPSQIAIAKRLNVPLEEYAKYVKE
jgi:chromosome segregation ATPase